MTSLDRALGRKRRYDQQQLADLLASTGFEVVKLQSLCKLAGLFWPILGTMLGASAFHASRSQWIDRITPAARLLDTILPGEGLSLLAIGRKPAATVSRAAA
jgi:hypothetical protein